MRRCSIKARQRAQLRGVLWLLAASLLAGGLWLNRYVNTVIKPTLHELAEYEARATTVQAVNRAVAAALEADASLTDALFVQSGGIVSLDAAAAGAAQLRLVSAGTAQGLRGGAYPGSDGVFIHQYHTIQRSFAVVRHRQYDSGRQHRHADRIRRLPIGKCADWRRYPERLRRDLI